MSASQRYHGGLPVSDGNQNETPRRRGRAFVAVAVLATAVAAPAFADQPTLPGGCTNPAISGRVYVDANANGLFDTGEKPIAGSGLELRNAAGTLVGTTTSATDGTYSFVTDQTKATTSDPNAAKTDFGGPFGLLNNKPQPATGTVPKFDTALGCLTKVDVSRSGRIVNRITTENLASQARNLTVSATNRVLSIAGPGVVSAVGTAPDWTASATLAANDGVANSGLDFKDFGDQPFDFAPVQAALTAAADLAAYSGTGTVTFSSSTDTNSSNTAGSDHDTKVRTGAAALVRVGYTFIPPLSPGQYTVTQRPQPNGYIDGRDTAGNVTPIPGSDRTDVIPVSLPATGNAPNNNFGETQFNDLKISKDDGVTVVKAAGSTTYKIVATNLGPTDVVGARVVDALPPQIVASSSKWTCVASTNGKCPASGVGDIDALVDLPVNGTATFTLDAKIADGATGTIVNSATVATPPGTVDPTPENNIANDTDTVVPLVTITGAPVTGSATLSIVKQAPAKAIAGQVIPYRIRVRNTSANAALNVVLRDPLPAGLTLVSRQQLARQTSLKHQATVFTLSLGTIPARGIRDIVLNVRISRTRKAAIHNVACAVGTNTQRVCDPADTVLVGPPPKPIVPAVTG